MRAKPAFAHRPEPGARRKLKIGYLSADFHRHATAHLMAELFERHDRTRFEIIAYSLGQDDRSEMRYRLGRAFDRFVDLVFAPRTGVAEHLARQRLADLFLDTLPYNAHTTTSNALRVGLPVVTVIGETFVGRGGGKSFAVAPIAAPIAAEPQTRISRRLYAACPLCASADHAPIIAADCTRHPDYRTELPPVTRWHACNCCGHIFAEGYFDGAIFAPRQEDMLGHEMENGRRAAASVVARVAHLGDASRAWLDVDFGNGALLFTAAERGFRAIGIDHREANVAGLRQLGLEAHRGAIEDLAETGVSQRDQFR